MMLSPIGRLAGRDWAFHLYLSPMPNTQQDSPHSFDERRNFFRITTDLPIAIAPEGDDTELALVPQTVNISGGGIGLVTNTAYKPGDILVVKMLLPGNIDIQAKAEVVRAAPLPRARGAFRIGARFTEISTKDRDHLIQAIHRIQQKHLATHYPM